MKLFAVLLSLLLFLSGEPYSHAARAGLAASPGICAFNWISNGNFEQGDTAWLSIPDPHSMSPHALIAPFDEAYDGEYSAVLGGDEHTVDSIRQQVTIPAGGRLTYWWRMHTAETTVFHDSLSVALLNDQGAEIQSLAWHNISGIQDTWFQDTLDLSAYAGSKVWLDFSVYNDGWFFSTFFIDSVCLAGANLLFFPLIAK